MKKVHLIGNAHLDPVWLWRWQEGFSEVLATFRSALDRMNDFDNFKFTSACSVYYEWVEKIDPEMFEEIKARVKEGRWNIVGGWYLQPDCNIPDGESFARHELIAQNYFKEKFGVTAKTGYNVDSFGHNAGLPKILKAGGIENYVFMRPFPEEQNRNENVFWWESDDGTRICTFRIPKAYNINLKNTEIIKDLSQEAKDTDTELMAFYGVGNHGGGPTIALINEINGFNLDNTVYSTPDEYFESINKTNLPVIQGDLQHHARGCYSAISAVKAANRKCEQNLLAAERMSILANKLTGAKYPAAQLKKAWKNLLFNQFHDILCGCSIKSAYDDAAHLFGETMSITEQAINLAAQKIAWNIDTLGDEDPGSFKTQALWKVWQHEKLGTPVIVFNPNTHPVKMVTTVNQNAKRVTDSLGNEIPFQYIRGEQTNFKDKYHIAFVADVPALGYAVYRMFPCSVEDTIYENAPTVNGTTLENSNLKIEFDSVTGEIASIYDKNANEFILNAPCSAVILDETDCDTWAHGKEYLGEKVGCFEKPEFKIIENGAVRTTMRVTQHYGTSVLRRDYSLIADGTQLLVDTEIDFHEKHKVLKFAFPTNSDTVTSKIPYGTITKAVGLGEEPCGSWFATDKLCVANDSKYAYDSLKGEVRMTVLRSPLYADHFGERDEFCVYTEQGIQSFKYSVFAYTTNAAAERNSAELNMPVFNLLGTFRKGTLPERAGHLSCDNDSIIVTAVKQGDDGESTVLRAYDADGRDADANISLLGEDIKTAFTHNALKTFKNGKETDILEQ